MLGIVTDVSAVEGDSNVFDIDRINSVIAFSEQFKNFDQNQRRLYLDVQSFVEVMSCSKRKSKGAA